MSRILEFEHPPGKPVLRGNDHYWSIIRELDRHPLLIWTISAVLSRSKGADRSSVRDFVRRLVAAGIARQQGTAGIRDEATYRLLNRPIATPCLRRDGTAGLQGRGQIQMWNVIRGPLGRQGFTTADVALFASTDAVGVKRATAVSYVKHLLQAGYLLTIRQGKPNAPAIYRLKPAMNTGPQPPLILRSQIVFDQNRQEAVGPVAAREVAP